VTTIIGREFPDLQITDLMEAPNSEQMIRDLAILVSQRGVVFLRNQKLDIEPHKKFCDELGRLTGRPENHTLHINPIFNSPINSPYNEAGDFDPTVYVINSSTFAKLNKNMPHYLNDVPDAASGWHSDGTFEVCPNDYSMLIMNETPPTGGDTAFASANEIYDRVSPSLRSYFETLTVACGQPMFRQSSTEGGYSIVEPRGSPLNVGFAEFVDHPLVRTNPVTGWKSIYGLGLHSKKINDVYAVESQMIRDYLMRLLTRNHDLQCRIRWNKGDVAIWDNRSVFHSATRDVTPDMGLRAGNRTSSTGERPYFDPASKSRREALAAQKS